MSYSNKVLESQKKSANHATAKKIKQLMDELYLVDYEKSSRRWVWELLQNAKDASYKEALVEFKINKTKFQDRDVVIISHNGRPFSIDNITFLIEQESDKNPQLDENGIPKSSGRFGTGFLTTHLLSEIVDVQGVLKEPELPYRKFLIRLDRSGKEFSDIIQSVNNSIEALKNIDNQPEFKEFQKENLNTQFIYWLSPQGEKVTNVGIHDLDISLPYTMAFLKKISIVNIENQLISFNLIQEPRVLSENIQLITIEKEEFIETKIHNIIVCKNNNVSIAVPVSVNHQTISLVGLDLKTPKLFCDFPLVGTEDYPFPFIINSPNFHPEEPRDNIFLNNPPFETNPKVEENREILLEAAKLFSTLLEFAIENNWQNIHNLAQFINSSSRTDLTTNDWFKKNIIVPIRKKVLTSKMITNSLGTKVCMANEHLEPIVFFPKAKNKDELLGIWELSKDFQPDKIPSWEQVSIWSNIIWKECGKITLTDIAKWISEQKNVSTLQNHLSEDKNVFEWLNKVYELIMKSEDRSSIEFEHDIFPNQNGDFSNIDSLFWEDEYTDETIKDILVLLGNDVRKNHLDARIYYKAPLNRTHDISFLSSELNNCINNELKKVTINSEHTKTAFKKLLIWINKNEESAKEHFLTIYEKKHKLLADDIVISNLQKAEEIDEILEEFKVVDINELRKILTEKRNASENDTYLEPFTKEILASLGVTTPDELIEALRDKDLAQLFAHRSTPTIEMYEFAQGLIERAKQNVMNHLSNLPAYDVSQAELISNTIYAGVKKDDKDINIVIRPSDNGEVILYYGAEKDALDFEISELWVDNGIDIPRHISFGKLIKDTGINRFPIK